MTRLFGAVLATALSFASQGILAQETRADDCVHANKAPLLSQGCIVLDGFMKAFNSKDGPAWASVVQGSGMWAR